MKLLLMAVGIVAIGGLAYLIADDYRRAELFGGGGYIESGSMFDIEIGMERSRASEIMIAKGFELRPLPSTGRCNNRQYPSEQTIESWLNFSRNGHICLASMDEKIVSMSWSIGGWEF